MSPLGDFFIAGTQARFCKIFQSQWKYYIFDTKMQFSHHATSAGPMPSTSFWGVQNLFCSIKHQLNFEVTFTCHLAPLYGPTYAQLGPNLAPTWPPKCLSNQSKDDVNIQLARKSIFWTPLKRNASFCFSKGVPNWAQTPSKTTSYTDVFSTKKKHASKHQFLPFWLPLGHPKAPPRGLQSRFKAALGSLLACLGCEFHF